MITGEDGRAPFPEGRAPLELRSGDPAWGISFVHAAREIDESLGEDMNGKKARVLDTSRTVAVVLERTGTLEIEVVGGQSGTRYYATFVDERPELYSHRQLRESVAFDGPKGSVRLPAGRGTLYLAEEGKLGTPVLGERTAPHLVSISSEASTTLRVKFLDGPVTTLQAAFESIPFKVLEAMAPDGRTIIGTFPFEKSPLRLPSRVAVALGTGFNEEMLLGARFPKHLLRAADIPLVRPEATVFDGNGIPGAEPGQSGQNQGRVVAPAPLDLAFAVDVGGKLRLPEIEAGWVKLAKEGAMIAAGIVSAPHRLHVGRPEVGKVVMPNPNVGDAGPVGPPGQGVAPNGQSRARPWTASVTATDATGKPAAHRELLVYSSNGILVRGLTDADGKLDVVGLLGTSATVAFVDDLGARAEAAKPAASAPAGTAVSIAVRRSGAPCPITGTWLAKPGGAPKVGHFLALVPRDGGERRARQVFLTRSVAISTVDSEGRFTFHPVPPGEYNLRTGEGGEMPLDVVSSSGAMTLSLTGTGESITSGAAGAPKGK